MAFPIDRPRRLRRTERIRGLVRETALSPGDLVYPMFVGPGRGVRQEIRSMPGQFNLSVDTAVTEAQEAAALGVPAVILFGIPAVKDARATGAWSEEGIVQQATRAIKKAVPDIMVITDVCLCEYTDHGHCGVVEGDAILNDPTLDLLAKTAVTQAQAGADIVAPSDMMDGRVAAIRRALDRAGHPETPIFAYSAKYASGFYGPFREAADSAPAFGDRRGYQMDPPNVREAVREALIDEGEQADMVMVKPALAYLDVIRATRDRFPELPLAAYNVSGEYAMVKAAGERGWIDEKRIVLEILTSIKRSGSDFILTYFAREAAQWIN